MLDRPVYSYPETDRLLRLTPGTARRWIDGYERAGREYPPVVRQERSGSPWVTWGEFVEARLLSEFRRAAGGHRTAPAWGYKLRWVHAANL